MFSQKQKKAIAAAVEKVLLSFKHPEMPKERPEFHLHVKGTAGFSWADIEPNWKYESEEPNINPWNEKAAQPDNRPTTKGD